MFDPYKRRHLGSFSCSIVEQTKIKVMNMNIFYTCPIPVNFLCGSLWLVLKCNNNRFTVNEH